MPDISGFLAVYGFIVIISLIVTIAIHCAVCRVFKEIAEEKGWTDRAYFAWVFFTGIVGMLMVVALPDKKARVDNAVRTAPAPGQTARPVNYAPAPNQPARPVNNAAAYADRLLAAAGQ